jgi:nicotinamide mononucleotide transporter
MLECIIDSSEALGAAFGLLSVYAAAKEHISTWPTGLVSVTFLSIVFYQNRLYADMFLQAYFFAMSIYGWHVWSSPRKKIQITKMSRLHMRNTLMVAIVGYILCLWLISSLHVMLPKLFPEPAEYVLSDSLVLTLSVAATYLMAIKKVESWYAWITVNILSVGIFYSKGLLILAGEYVIFLFLAIFGAISWNRSIAK